MAICQQRAKMALRVTSERDSVHNLRTGKSIGQYGDGVVKL
jgi:hypothetical protein